MLPKAILLALFTLLVFFAPPLAPAASAEAKGTTTFREYGYGDRTAQGMYSSLDYFFAIPPGQIPQTGARLELDFSHSPVLNAERSTLTVKVNGSSIESVYLTSQNRDHAQLSVGLPTENFSGTGYFVQIAFYLRLTREECEETQNPALWATVYGDSAITLNTTPDPNGPQLQYLDGLFANPLTTRTSATFITPENFSANELEAAGITAFAFGRGAARAGQDPVLNVSHHRASDIPAILVANGARANVSQFGAVNWNGQSFTTSGGTIPNADGLLALAANPSPQLLVSGASEEGMLLAARALVEPERRVLLRGSYVVISDQAIAPLPAFAWENGAASFNALGIDRRDVTGPGEHVLDYFVIRPAGWILRDGSTLELDVASATALRPETSWVQVTINDQMLGTRRLNGDAGQNQKYQFQLPAELLNANLQGQPERRLTANVHLFLNIPEAGCIQSPPNSAHAEILNTSAYLLPHDNFEGLDLGRFPAPLLTASSTPLLVVIPQNPTDPELTAGLQTIAALGKWSVERVTNFPRLVTADRVDDAARRANHLILIGETDRNAVSAEAARANSALFAPPQPTVYAFNAGDARGMLRVARSPFSNALQVLTITGDVEIAARGLGANAVMQNLRGTTAWIIGNTSQTITGAEPPPQIPAPLAPQVVIPLEQRLPAWQIVGAIVLGAFVAGILVILVTRYRRKSS